MAYARRQIIVTSWLFLKLDLIQALCKIDELRKISLQQFFYDLDPKTYLVLFHVI